MKRFFLLLLLCCSLPMATMAKSPKDSYYFQRAVEAMESGDNETAIRYLSEEAWTSTPPTVMPIRW